jgi:hypothetical protein
MEILVPLTGYRIFNFSSCLVAVSPDNFYKGEEGTVADKVSTMNCYCSW